MGNADDTTRLTVKGMGCDGCAKTVRAALEAVPGVTGAEVSLEAGTAVVHGRAAADALVAAVVDAGYDAVPA